METARNISLRSIEEKDVITSVVRLAKLIEACYNCFINVESTIYSDVFIGFMIRLDKASIFMYNGEQGSVTFRCNGCRRATSTEGPTQRVIHDITEFVKHHKSKSKNCVKSL